MECDIQDEIDAYWAKSTEDSSESSYDWLKDRFGVSWQIIPNILSELTADSKKGPRVRSSLYENKKNAIATLLNA
jgi:predicted 3-demethylubiquinone-9 3-methyltransferase (glyoxalase superfamily)